MAYLTPGPPRRPDCRRPADPPPPRRGWRGALLGLACAGAAVLAAAVAVTVLSLGYDMTQPLLAGVVTALGGQRPGQAMGLNVCLLFTGFGLGSLLFGGLLRFGFWSTLALWGIAVGALVLAFR